MNDLLTSHSRLSYVRVCARVCACVCVCVGLSVRLVVRVGVGVRARVRVCEYHCNICIYFLGFKAPQNNIIWFTYMYRVNGVSWYK